MPTSPFVQAIDGEYACPYERCPMIYTALNSLRKHCRRRHEMSFTMHRPKEISIEEKQDCHRLYCAVYRKKKKLAVKSRLPGRRDYFIAADADERGAFGCDHPLVEYRPSEIEGAGNGLFACEDLMPGGTVTWCAGKVTDTEPDDPSYAIEIEKGFLDCIRVPIRGEAMQWVLIVVKTCDGVTSADDIVPETDSEPEQKRPSRTWVPVKQRLRDAFGLLRTLLFIHVEGERVCLRLRGFLQFHQWSVSWLVLLQSRRLLKRSLHVLLQNLEKCTPESKAEELKQQKLCLALSALLAQVLHGDVTEYCPLLEKLSKKSRLTMNRIIGEEYTRELSSGGSLLELPDFKSWFAVCMREPQDKIKRSLTDLSHDAKRDAFSRKPTRAMEKTATVVRRNKITKEHKERQQEKTWAASDEQAYDQVYDQAIKKIKEKTTSAMSEEKLMLRRSRKYRLFPTKAQEKSLKHYMGTCRWTYNQAVAHFRKTNEFKAEHLRDLYVTKMSKKTIAYPEGMGPPPEWVFDTPKTLRFNAVRVFQTNVKSAFSNLKNGNINKFRIGFSSKKRSPYFTITEDGVVASIKEKQSTYYLSISCLKDIRVKMDAHVDIKSEIDILYSNGFWYVAILEYVQPSEYENRGKCIALDPGIKAFVTGVDLEGNVLEFGRDTKTHLNKLRARRNEAQSVMSKFKDGIKKSTHRQYRAYARAKRTFLSCTAKMKNCVKELHYQTTAYLAKHYDAILLPIFQTKNMVGKKQFA